MSAWPSHLRQTYSILRPANEAGAGEFWRPATCEEFECGPYLHGWTTTLEIEKHAAQVHYIRAQSGRSFTEDRDAAGLVTFRFSPGQPCFRSGTHQLPIEREALYVVRGGDARAWTGTRRMHSSAIDWRDDFGENQERLADAHRKG